MSAPFRSWFPPSLPTLLQVLVPSLIIVSGFEPFFCALCDFCAATLLPGASLSALLLNTFNVHSLTRCLLVLSSLSNHLLYEPFPVAASLPFFLLFCFYSLRFPFFCLFFLSFPVFLLIHFLYCFLLLLFWTRPIAIELSLFWYIQTIAPI